MSEHFVNVSCGNRKLPGFINLDVGPGADIIADIHQGLPFANGSIQGIYSEHCLEYLTQGEGLAFLRECRRVLMSQGIMRLVTLDFNNAVSEIDPEVDLARIRVTYDWVQTDCEAMNLALQGNWEYGWVYNQEELIRLAALAGLVSTGQQTADTSGEPRFRDLGIDQKNGLIVEFIKDRPPEQPADRKPLVGVVIPAYNPHYFQSALQSVLHQSYSNIEILICDDSPTDEISGIVADASAGDERIRYIRNKERLGGYLNYQQCLDRSNGEYIKFLNDDDLLHPQCVARMVRCLNRYPDVTLVTSHRQPIDHQGKVLKDLTATIRPVLDDALIDGISVCGALLSKETNFVGEPSTTMFRKRDMELVKPTMMSLAGIPAKMNGDVLMWLNLLSRGHLIYLVETLSYFRIHAGQRQAQPDVQKLGDEAWLQFREHGQRLGFWQPEHPVGLQDQPLERRAQWSDDLIPILEQANEFLSADDYDQAAAKLSEAATLAPDDPWLIVTLGNVYVRTGDLESARKEYIKAVTLFPEHIPGYLGIGTLALQTGNLKEAENALLRVVALQPTNLEVSNILGRLYLQMERFEDGIKAYTYILHQAPEDVECLLALGICHFGAGNLKVAGETFRRVLDIDPQNKLARENLAAVSEANSSSKINGE